MEPPVNTKPCKHKFRLRLRQAKIYPGPSCRRAVVHLLHFLFCFLPLQPPWSKSCCVGVTSLAPQSHGEFGAVLYYAILCHTIQCFTILCYIILDYTVPCCANMLYDRIQDATLYRNGSEVSEPRPKPPQALIERPESSVI